jgi:hypothetical protein
VYFKENLSSLIAPDLTAAGRETIIWFSYGNIFTTHPCKPLITSISPEVNKQTRRICEMNGCSSVKFSPVHADIFHFWERPRRARHLHERTKPRVCALAGERDDEPRTIYCTIECWMHKNIIEYCVSARARKRDPPSMCVCVCLLCMNNARMHSAGAFTRGREIEAIGICSIYIYKILFLLIILGCMCVVFDHRRAHNITPHAVFSYLYNTYIKEEAVWRRRKKLLSFSRLNLNASILLGKVCLSLSYKIKQCSRRRGIKYFAAGTTSSANAQKMLWL